MQTECKLVLLRLIVWVSCDSCVRVSEVSELWFQLVVRVNLWLHHRCDELLPRSCVAGGELEADCVWCSGWLSGYFQVFSGVQFRSVITLRWRSVESFMVQWPSASQTKIHFSLTVSSGLLFGKKPLLQWNKKNLNLAYFIETYINF